MRFHLVPLVLLAACAPGSGVEFVFEHADGQTKSSYSSGTVSVSHNTNPWSVDFRVVTFGRIGDTSRVDPVSPSKSLDGRAVYDHGTFTEWYDSRADGLKQGFDLQTAPAGTGEIVVGMEVRAGLLPVLRGDGQGVNFLDKDGVVTMRYDELVVLDADGDEVPSRMELECRRSCMLSLVVDDTGADYPLEIDPRIWSPSGGTVIDSPIGTGSNDQFGWAVAIDDAGTTAIVGARNHDPSGASNSGRAFVLELSGGTWTSVATLQATTPLANGRFGSAVDIDGDTIIVGAPDLSNATPGAAFVFREVAGTWSTTPEATLAPAAGTFANGDQFGSSVAIEGDVAAVGAPLNDLPVGSNRGAVYVFSRSGTTWSGATRLTNATGLTNGAQAGRAVDIEGGNLAVGAFQYDADSVNNSGAVLMYTGSGTTWAFDEIVSPSVDVTNSRFGTSLELDGTSLIVGAPSSGSANIAGRAYVFTESAGAWGGQQTLVGSESEANDLYGFSVSISGAGAVVGAPLYDEVFGAPIGTQTDRGTAYVWALDGTWSEEDRFIPNGAGASDRVGNGVAIVGDEVLVGGPNVDGATGGAGVVYQYTGDDVDGDVDGFEECTGPLAPPYNCDCNDDDFDIKPGATEIEANDVDENCDDLDALCGSNVNPISGCLPVIVITEILAIPGNGVDPALGQYIEIVNRSTHRVDLAGGRLTHDDLSGINPVETVSIPTPFVLDVGEYAVFAGSTDSLLNGGLVADADLGDIDLETDFAEIRIQARNGFADRDLVFYPQPELPGTNTMYTGTAMPEGASMSLDPDFMTTANNDIATYWCDARTPFGDGQFGTPGSANDECDYTIPFTYTYTRVSNPPVNPSGTTTVTFDFDSTSRWFTTGNSGEGTFTRGTSDADGGQVLEFQYVYANLALGPIYTGTQVFGDDCVPAGTVGNLPSNFSSGTWDATDCP